MMVGLKTVSEKIQVCIEDIKADEKTLWIVYLRAKECIWENNVWGSLCKTPLKIVADLLFSPQPDRKEMTCQLLAAATAPPEQRDCLMGLPSSMFQVLTVMLFTIHPHTTRCTSTLCSPGGLRLSNQATISFISSSYVLISPEDFLWQILPWVIWRAALCLNYSCYKIVNGLFQWITKGLQIIWFITFVNHLENFSCGDASSAISEVTLIYSTYLFWSTLVYFLN